MRVGKHQIPFFFLRKASDSQRDSRPPLLLPLYFIPLFASFLHTDSPIPQSKARYLSPCIHRDCPRSRIVLVVQLRLQFLLTSEMAIRNMNSTTIMTAEEFKQWLMRYCADGGDGRISERELRNALKDLGCWFAHFKSKRIMRKVDINNTGKGEIDGITPHIEQLLSVNFRYTDY